MINYTGWSWLPEIKTECSVRYFEDGISSWVKCFIVGETKDGACLVAHTYHDDELHFVFKVGGNVRFLPILSGGAKDMLYKLFEVGHIQDGDLPSKSGMSELIHLGLAFKDYDCVIPNGITKLGIAYFLEEHGK